jgi:hypothetical protein
MGKKGFLACFCLTVGMVMLQSTDAWAYLDPGAGSLMLQFAIASVVGALFAIKMFWKKIAAFMKRLFRG